MHGYAQARNKQKSQAWETYLGPVATGGSAAIGSALAAIGAGVVKSTGGWLLFAFGIVFALAGSVFSANSYVRNRSMKLRYLRLLYDLTDYCFMVLPTAAPADVFVQLDAFRQLWETAGT
jgi:bacteriorhodopsin